MARRGSRVQVEEEDVELNMTPMLDIVFILLIFFIVTATFLQEEGFSMTPPPPCEGPDCGNSDNVVILVQVDGDNRVFVNQRAAGEHWLCHILKRLVP